MAKISLKLPQIDQSTIDRWLPERPRNAHKGDFGRLLMICGAVGYTGAPELVAKAAVRAGAGLVFSYVPQEIYPIIAAKLTEPMVFPAASSDGKFSEAAIGPILERLSASDACLIGCGMGVSEATYRLTAAVLAHARCPVVVDADGINVLRGHIDVLRGAACPVILTPHEGEFARLGGDLGGGRLKAARWLHGETGATVLLKGHRTIVCGDGGCFRNPTGNPGMATGGSGDVLAGLLTALLGQGLPPTRAAAAAAWLHGRAGDLCAARSGECGLLPSDIIAELPRLLK